MTSTWWCFWMPFLPNSAGVQRSRASSATPMTHPRVGTSNTSVTSEASGPFAVPIGKLSAIEATDPVVPLASCSSCDNNLSFVAHLRRQDADEPLGLRADLADERVVYVCCVTAEGHTAIARYNASVPDGKRIKVGDYFMAINGKSPETVQPPQKVSEALCEELINARCLEVNVRRQQLFECQVDKHGPSIHLELSYSHNGAGLVVARITSEGVAVSTPEIRLGDRIVGVDGTEGSPDMLFEAIRGTGDTIPLLISRPAVVPLVGCEASDGTPVSSDAGSDDVSDGTVQTNALLENQRCTLFLLSPLETALARADLSSNACLPRRTSSTCCPASSLLSRVIA